MGKVKYTGWGIGTGKNERPFSEKEYGQSVWQIKYGLTYKQYLKNLAKVATTAKKKTKRKPVKRKPPKRNVFRIM